MYTIEENNYINTNDSYNNNTQYSKTIISYKILSLYMPIFMTLLTLLTIVIPQYYTQTTLLYTPIITGIGTAIAIMIQTNSSQLKELDNPTSVAKTGFIGLLPTIILIILSPITVSTI